MTHTRNWLARSRPAIPGMKYWMMNIVITSLEKELSRLCKEATARFDQTLEGLKASEEYLKEFLENEQCELGRVNATLKLMLKERDEWSMQIEQELCKHPGEDVTEDGDSAVCKCGAHLGWYCPESPEKTCHYFTEKDEQGYYVELRTGEKYYLADYNKDKKENETDDECLFCGGPDERK